MKKFKNKNILKSTLLFSLLFLASLSSALASSSARYETAILSGGCFWGVQHLFDQMNGVVSSRVGYIGGNVDNPTYKMVSTGLTNHAEAIEITFDPQKISYEKLLKFFFTIHDPTTLNRQENDIGTQYRSEIFYLDEAQKEIALSVIEKAKTSRVFKGSIVTKVSKAGKFFSAEGYHQKYLKKNPSGYTCHHIREEWKF